MVSLSKTARLPSEPTWIELFTPKLVTVISEGYRLSHFRGDMIAGLTVAIVALPLSMAIAIASGATPAQGLYTAIVGGFLVSALGGSRFQIGGPAGAFIVLVAGTAAAHGIEGVVLATFLAGLMLLAIGALRLGTYVKFIPYPVTIGFTAGIAVIILASQLRPLLGLELDGAEPGPLLAKLPALAAAIETVDPATVALSVATIATILGLRRVRPGWPGMLIAVAGASVAAVVLDLHVATIGSAFGGVPTGLPIPTVPNLSAEKVLAVLPNAVAFAMLGAIESLLSAVVADGMTGRRHRSNCELVAQGVANVATALFGGICVTGTIARTATNVRAGAHGPVAGMMHSVFLLLFVVIAAPLASYIPLAALAGVLAVVSWNMVERHAIAVLVRTSRGDTAVLAVTLALTVLRDLTEAIVVGVALGSILFIHRMSRSTAVETSVPFVAEDRADGSPESREAYDEAAGSDPDVVVFRISGAFFFGAAATVGAVLERIADTHHALVIDFRDVPFVDSTAANTIAGLTAKTAKRGVRVVLTGTSPEMRDALTAHGVAAPHVTYHASIEDALADVGPTAPSNTALPR